MQLRSYQREAIDALYDYFQENDGNPLLVLPTAAGKSVIIGAFIRELMERWPGQRVLMLTHVKELIAQNARKLATLWPEAPLGVYSASLNSRDIWDPIIFAGIQSVHKKARQLGRFDLVIIDECHLVSVKSSGMYRKFIADMRAMNPAVKIIGLTATNFRTGTGDITHGDDALFTDVAYEVGLLDLLQQGYICRLISKRMAGEVDTSALHVRQGEFVQKEVKDLVDRRELIELALDEVMQYGGERRAWLIFCAGVDHAYHVKDALIERGIAAECVTGKTPKPERDRIIEDYKAGNLRAITNCDVLTTGFDAPATDLLVFLRPTHSPGLYVQMMGRGMRLSPETGKENCLVLDFAGNVIRHGPVDQVRAWIPKNSDRQAAPVKTCPVCSAIVAASARICLECDHEFPIEESEKHSANASTASVLSDEIEKKARHETHRITGVEYYLHEKPGKPTSLRVEYYAGWLCVAKDWVCLEHGGYARAKACSWWRKRSSTGSIPATTDEALLRADELIKPSSITVNAAGKYTEIIDYEFSDTESESGVNPDAGECAPSGESIAAGNVVQSV
ncbi:MAG: DEAD/DEAH box helicase family protein [Chromatiaceae bacterium]|nr:DEAD/DEAH box helicase family protein [Chromatiaceae bacterium]